MVWWKARPNARTLDLAKTEVRSCDMESSILDIGQFMTKMDEIHCSLSAMELDQTVKKS